MSPEPVPSAERRQALFTLVAPHLDRLRHFVRHVVAYHEAIGDLRPGEIAPDEIVDAVLVRAARDFPESAPPRQVKRWLIGLAREQLAADLRRLKSWHRRTPVHTEDDVAETPPEEYVTQLGEETLFFHEPDEDLKVEDVLPDLDLAGPDEEAERDELRWCVDAALATLPAEAREILLRRHVDGMAAAELARVTGKPEAEVARILDGARQTLRQRLVESGCAHVTEQER